jgi:hypothetical protein
VTWQAFQRGHIYLGWQYAPRLADPGPPPRRPVPPDAERLDPGWLAAQRREENRLSRPAKVAACAGLALAGGVVLLGRAGLVNPALTALGVAAFGGLAMVGAGSVWRGRQSLRADIAAERRRVAAARAAREGELFASQEDHARRFRDWEGRERAFSAQPVWYPVALPGEIDRVDLVGGTLAGWSALLTTVAVPRLAAGDELTVLDLSEGTVARDLVTLAADAGIDPLVWVLPADLPRFDLGVGLPAAALADVLGASVAAGLAEAGHDPARDHALLDRLLAVLGDGARVSQVTAGLRALGQVGDPREDVRLGRLTPGQLERITRLFGRGAADRVVIERAWALEARLRVLDRLGCDPVPVPRSRLRVVALDRGGGMFGNSVLGTYVAVSLTHLLRHASPGRPWRHTLCVAGAEKLGGEVVDRLTGACETTSTGLVLAYRAISPQVRERLGRGNAALVVMRLGNAEDAKVAADQIGTQHRFVLSQFTDTVGASVTDTAGDSYTSTVGTADSWASSVSRSETSGRSWGRGHSSTGFAAFAPRTGSGSREASESWGTSDSESISDGISTSTSWGVSTATAIGLSESLATTAQRSREFLVEPHELQQLPPSAAIVSYGSRAGRQVLLLDANPAIRTLPTATTSGPAEMGQARPDRAEPPGPGRGEPPWPDRGEPPRPQRGGPPREPVSWRAKEGRPPPNLGPPPEPPDWRKRRR